MRTYPRAADGLKKMFIAEILVIIGSLLAWIPLLGSVLSIVGGILCLVGLHTAGGDDEGYRSAFTLSIINIVLTVILVFVAAVPILGSLLSIVSSLISLAVIFYVCRTTSNLCSATGHEDVARKGNTVWTINLVCTIVSVVLSLLILIPIVNVLAAVAMLVVAIVELVGYILYLIFLYKGSAALA